MPEADAENSAETPVGEYLRSVRESKGLQLDDAARVTKISRSYLVAIEEGQFEKLPNAAYIKGFLRLYAGFLSLSGDDVVARYERGLPAAARPQVEPARQAPGMGSVESTRSGGRSRWLIPALLLALVLVAAFFLTEGEEQKPAPFPTPAPAPLPAPVQAPVTAPIQRQPTSARTEAAVVPAPVEPVPTILPARKGGIVLRLRFKEDSWLAITIDDSISQRYDLKAGDIIEWKGQRTFALDLGDGGAVEGEFNGKPFKSLGDPGKPAHVELKSEPQTP